MTNSRADWLKINRIIRRATGFGPALNTLLHAVYDRGHQETQTGRGYYVIRESGQSRQNVIRHSFGHILLYLSLENA